LYGPFFRRTLIPNPANQFAGVAAKRPTGARAGTHEH
jgi:hypothetical protein